MLTSRARAAPAKLTEDFLKAAARQQGGVREAGREGGRGRTGQGRERKVAGDRATALVLDENRSTLSFVKEDGEWLASGVQLEQGGDEAGPAAVPDDPATGDEAEARAAANALLVGVEGDDPAVLCATFSERYANQLTGAKEFGLEELC